MPDPSPTLYWHDYETFDSDPIRCRPAQFAGLRTDAEFNPVGEPLVLYCKPAADMLPHPEACLITGITPQLAWHKGVIEAEFIARIHDELARPGTCTVGYNNLRFDDEVTRHALYRNFFDPYAREWQNNNSRWDLIDVVRMCYALRPEGLEWPVDEEGVPSFKLENLSAANRLTHDSAHDALSDVYATIELAKLIRNRQPRLYDYAFSLRKKQTALNLLNVKDKQPVLHTSSMFPARWGCTSVVVPVALHPVNKNGIVVCDLRHDPTELLEAGVDEIRERLFTRTGDLPDGVERFHLKTVHINKCPMLAPLNTLTGEARKRLQLDMDEIEKHLEAVRRSETLESTVREALQHGGFAGETDPEFNLYGGFFSDADRDRIVEVRRCKPEALAGLQPAFDDPRLPELLFRYRARNWPETLSPEEQLRWREHCREKLTGSGAGITLAEYEMRLQALAESGNLDDKQMEILEALAEYAAAIETNC